MTEDFTPFEVLKIDEFAKRLKVGKSVVFDWKKDGILIRGHHYFQAGKVLRFIWSRDLVLDLDNSKPDKVISEPSTPQKKVKVPEVPKKIRRVRKVGVNLNY